MDLRGSLSKNLFNFRGIISIIFWTPFLYSKMKLYDIKIGDSCIFWGNSILVRKPNSQITIGKGCEFFSGKASNLIGINRQCIISTLKENALIVIGNNCGFSGTVIGSFARIELQDNVRCGANTLITDSDWHTDDPRSGKSKPVFIGRNVWLGEGAKILKGVTIGENSVIGAGSVVTKNIPANVVAAGNPCKVIKVIL